MLNESFQIPNTELDNFIGSVKKEIIDANTFLFRFVTVSHNELIGNWWIKDKVLMQIFQTAPSSEIFRNNLRSRFAVKEKWNPKFEYLLSIQLIQSVWGWSGKTKYQSSSLPNSNIIYMGQGYQCYVPNLSKPDDLVDSDYARIVKFEDTEGIFW